MAAPSAQLDRSDVRDRVLDLIRVLLEELGSRGAVPILGASSHLDRDLGLGSLERVELVARLEKAFSVRIPERAAAEANTPDDLATAIFGAPASAADEPNGAPRLCAAITSKKLHREAVRNIVASAETLLDILRLRAAHDPAGAHLLITEDGREEEITLTYGELYAAGQRVAAELARHGVPAGGRVALMLPTSRAFFVSYAGILLAGAVPVPIYPPFRADRIEEYASRQAAILQNAEVCLLLTFRRAEAVARLLKPRVPSLATVAEAGKFIEAADKAPPPAPGALPLHLTGSRARKPGDIALLQYTSGSTGSPKGVILTHANLLANMRAIGEAMQLSPEDIGVSWLPLYHDMGLIGAWLTLLLHGIPVVVMSPLAFLMRPERWLWSFHKHRGTITAAPNFAYELCVRKIADKDIEGLDLSSMRAALNGAEPVNPETLERFAQRFARYGFRREAQLPVYGLAEASLAVTVPPLDRGPLVDRIQREPFASEGRAVPADPSDATAIAFVSSGRPIPGHDVMIVNERGAPVSDRTEGFLWFRGPSATSGYFRNVAATAELLPKAEADALAEFPWLNSGDRAYRASGEIFVTGRVKDIIIKGGRNLYPHEIEELAARTEGIRKGCTVAFGVKDEASGTEKLIVVAEARESNSTRKATIAAAVRDNVTQGLGLPPDQVELIPPGSIPKTSSGKLRREETKQLYLAGKLSAAKPPVWIQIAKLGASAAAKGFGRAVFSVLSRAARLAYGIYFLIVFVLWIVPTWAVVQLFRDHRAAGRFTSSALQVLFALVGIRVEVVGKEHMSLPGAKIYASNHGSYFDVLPLMLGLGVPYRFVAKSEVHQMPFIGTFLRRMGHLSFNRGDSASRLHQAGEIEAYLRRGDSIFVFPEGTFTPEDGVRPFQLGAFRAAVDTGAPIIPVSLQGSRHVLRDTTYLPRLSHVRITLSPPIFPRVGSDDPNAWQEVIRLRDAAREQIARFSGEPML